MLNKRRYVTAGVTLVAALATAHVMQQGDAPSSVNGASVIPMSAGFTPAPNATPPANEVTLVAAVAPETAAPLSVETNVAPEVIETLANDVKFTPMDKPVATVTAEFPTPPADVMMPTPLPSGGTELRDRMSIVATVLETPAVEEVQRNKFGLRCGPILSASANGDAGLVNLTLSAPCRSEQRLNINHGPLRFTGQTDTLGIFQIEMPAMTVEAMFKVTFEDGESVDTVLDIPAVKNIERVALVADGNSGLQIHALEFGADYGEKGHVWAEAPGDATMAGLDGGGFLMRLGDTSLENATISEVYTFPATENSQTGVVRLSVEAEVTAMNCATEIEGQSIEPMGDGTPLALSMTVSIPDCDAIGEYLVLKNLLRDLRIASR